MTSTYRYYVTHADLNLYVASAMVCVKLFAFFVKKKKVFSIDTFCYDSLLRLCLFNHIPWGTEFFEFLEFFLYGVITDVTYISIFYLFLPPLVCYAFQSNYRNFYLSFIVHFSFYRTLLFGPAAWK